MPLIVAHHTRALLVIPRADTCPTHHGWTYHTTHMSCQAAHAPTHQSTTHPSPAPTHHRSHKLHRSRSSFSLLSSALQSPPHPSADRQETSGAPPLLSALLRARPHRRRAECMASSSGRKTCPGGGGEASASLTPTAVTAGGQAEATRQQRRRPSTAHVHGATAADPNPDAPDPNAAAADPDLDLNALLHLSRQPGDQAAVAPPIHGARQQRSSRAKSTCTRRRRSTGGGRSTTDMDAVAGLDCFSVLGFRVVSVNLLCNFILLLCKFILTAM
jgi:hypothetical protein